MYIHICICISKYQCKWKEIYTHTIHPFIYMYPYVSYKSNNGLSHDHITKKKNKTYQVFRPQIFHPTPGACCPPAQKSVAAPYNPPLPIGKPTCRTHMEVGRTVDGSEIPNNHLGCIKPCTVNNGNKLPTATGAGFFTSTVSSHRPQRHRIVNTQV